MTDTCPACNANLQGTEIPVDSRHLYADNKVPWRRLGREGTHFSRLIGIEIPGVYDGVLFWQCPDCGAQWHRWPKGNELRIRAAAAMTNEFRLRRS